MNTRFLMWFVVLASGASLGIAHAQSITTLDPSFFSPGTDLSNAFSGVTLSTMTIGPNGTNAQGVPLLAPSFAPVYADGALFSPQSSPPPSSTDWGGTFFLSTEPCFDGCERSSPGSFFGPNLLISFNTPVDMVTALQIDNPLNGVLMEAFDSSNQLIGSCLPTFSPQPQGNYGCYSVLNSNNNPCGDNDNCQYATSISAPDISKILLGGFNMPDQIGAVQYEAVRAPEIDPTSAVTGFTSLLGGLFVLRGRRVAKPG